MEIFRNQYGAIPRENFVKRSPLHAKHWSKILIDTVEPPFTEILITEYVH